MWEISVAVIAAAFVVLTVYLIMTLRTARESMQQMNSTIERLEQQVDGLSGEAQQLLKNSREMTADLQGKVKSLDGVFATAQQLGNSMQRVGSAVEQAGEAVHEVTSSVKQVSTAVSHNVTNKVQRAAAGNANTIDMAITFLTSGLQLWNTLKETNKRGEEQHVGKQQ